MLGVDANALYLWCMDQEMPAGYPRRMHAKDQFKTEENVKGYSKMAHTWLEWISMIEGRHIKHAMNGGEHKIGNRRLLVDGFDAQTGEVLQFHGCFWHGHPCSKTKGMIINAVRKTPMKELYETTIHNEQYLRDLGHTVRVLWECEWEKMIKTTPKLQEFVEAFNRSLYPRNSIPLELEDCIKMITDGSFFGLVECDISVPDELKDKFSEMAPIFKNIEVGREHLSEHMKDFAEQEDYLNNLNVCLWVVYTVKRFFC